jgi:hypothetical protein
MRPIKKASNSIPTEKLDQLWQNWAKQPDRIELAARVLHWSVNTWFETLRPPPRFHQWLAQAVKHRIEQRIEQRLDRSSEP